MSGSGSFAAAVLDRLSEGVVVTRAADGVIVFTNPAWDALCGYEAGALTGQHLSTVCPSTPELEDGWRGEVQNVRKDGTSFWSVAHVAGFDDAEHGPLRIVLHVDATARREVDAQKDAFLQAVSHDLRNPLIVIEGFASLLHRQDAQLEDDARREYARRIADAAKRMRRQLNDLLDLDRLSRNVIEPRREPTDVHALAVEAVAALHASDRVEVVGETLVADVDAAQVERILENLVANACRHAPSPARIWVLVALDGDDVLLRVDDDGPGVEPSLRERIFNVFESGEADTAGTGIGLSLVRRFAELHGGQAWVEERDGGGASFRVRLPASHAPAGDR